MGSKPRIAIVGAGIGGLSLGLALRERGLQANVFEQASELTEIGAAIAMSANSTREFMRLGLVDQIAAASTIPTELIYRHWRDGNRIAAHPVAKDDWYVRRFGAPYFGIHRADLQKILSGAFGVENLHLGCRLVNIVDQAESVVLEFANGRVEHASLVVGADGVRSTVRRWVTGADDAIYSSLFGVRPLLRWHRGRVVVLGDAAHGMLPHHGQGANTSIEDAFALAALLADANVDDLEPVLSCYQGMRRARTRKIQRSSWVTNSLLHLLDGPATWTRDERMATAPQDFAWIHAYDVQEALGATGATPAADAVAQA